MAKKTANEVIDTIAAAPALDAFFAKTTAAVRQSDMDAVVDHYRRERVLWLDNVKKKLEKKG